MRRTLTLSDSRFTGYTVHLESGPVDLLWSYIVVTPEGMHLDANGLAELGYDALIMAIIDTIGTVNESLAS